MLIKVKAFANSKQEKIVKKKEDSFDVFVKEKAEDGKANKRIIEVLATYFNVKSWKIRMVKGAKERSKIFSVSL